jgi:branched-chain amino acid transport system substrate-binding protein
MSAHGNRAYLVAVLALGGILSACPHNPGAVGGTHEGLPKFEPKKSSEADDALAKAKQKAETASRKEAVEAYLAVRKAYPESTAGQEALYDAGVLYFEQGDYVSARKKLNELLFENPLFDKAQDAKLKLGIAALEVGAYRDAYQTLSTLAERLSGVERTQALEKASVAAESGQLYAEALKIAIHLAEEAKEPEQQKRQLTRVTELVEGRVGFLDIAKAAEDTSTSSPAWPVLQFKLARIYYHLRDFNRLTETLQRFLHEAPSSPYAPQAQELLQRANRSAQIKPKAIGVIVPMTGKFKLYGEAVMRGVGLALKDSDVEVVVKDSQGDAAIAGKAVEDLAYDDGVIGILGPVLGEDSKRAALVAEELQVPLLTLSHSEGITQIGPHVFRNMLTNSAQAKALADYATKVLGYKTFAALYPNMQYGVELTNDFWDEVLKQGGSMRGAESYDCDATTFTDPAKKLVGREWLEDRADWIEKYREVKAQNLDPFHLKKAIEKARQQMEPVVDFEALLIPDDWSRVTLVAPALAVEDIITNACDPRDVERIKKTTGKHNIKTVTLLGTNQWSSPKGPTGLPELVRRGDKFVWCSVYVDGFFADSDRPATKKFVNAYRELYKDTPNREPSLLEASGYDSAKILKSVIDGSGPKTREQLRDSLSRVKGFDGATGKTSFNDQREAEKQLFLLSVDRNGVKEIRPDEKASRVGG